MTETARTGWKQRDPRQVATLAHYASLAAAFVFLLWLNRDHWFIADEWSTLTDRKLGGGDGFKGIFEPHNEHWSTIPVLVYRALFTVFGLRTYMPYIVVLVLVHLLIAHLLWRLMLRLGVEAFLAAVLCGAFAVLGAGADNLTIAWQMQLIAPLAAGIGALLLAPADGPLRRRDAGVIGLLVLGLMCSGVAVTMVGVVALVALLRRGWKVAAVTAGVPAVVYGIWYLAYGTDTAQTNRDSLSLSLQKLPAFVWRGLTDAADGMLGLEGIGPAVIAALVVWLVLRARASRADSARWDIPLAMGAGAVVFLGLTDLRRSGLGIDTAGTSRYVYVVVALLLPAGALAINALLERSNLRVVALVGLTALLLTVQLSELHRVSEEWTEADQSVKSRVLGTVALAREGNTFDVIVPVPQYMPGVTVDKLVVLDEDGKLPGGEVTERQRLDARLYTQVRVRRGELRRGTPPDLVLAGDARVQPGTSRSCRGVIPLEQEPGVQVEFPEDGAVTVIPGASEPLRLSLWGDGAVSEGRKVETVDGVPVTIQVRGGLSLGLGVPRSGLTQVCGLSDSSPRRL